MTDEELSEQSDGPEDVAPTKRLTRQLLDALGITRVINVDDDHAQGQIQSKESVIGALRAGTLDTVLVARFILPDEKDESAEALDLDEAITLVEERWEELGDDNRVELRQHPVVAPHHGGRQVRDGHLDPDVLEGLLEELLCLLA